MFLKVRKQEQKMRKDLEWQPYTFFYMDFRANNVKDNA